MDINKYKYISFDIFDTAIKRNVIKPTDIFKLVELKYFATGNKPDFINDRINAERELRVAEKREITLDEIYLKLEKIYGYNIAKDLKLLEIQIELNSCCTNHNIKEIYDKCIASGKEVLFISDMYLDKDTIQAMLNKCGYYKYSGLYISSEYRKTKSTGELYKIVQENLNIKTNTWLHIGDNKKSDYVMAIKNGIAAKHIPIWVNNLTYADVKAPSCLSESIIISTLNNNITPNMSMFNKLGFECFGPLLVGFINWLIKDLNEKNITKVYFFSRDGHIMKKVFDMINQNKIKSYYFYTSRRALQVPAIYINSNYENVMSAFFLPKEISVSKLMNKLGLEYDVVKLIATSYGYNANSIINCANILNNDNLKNFYNGIKPLIIKNAKSEYDGLTSYLKEMNFNGKVAMVDIGWFGNMQKALSEVVKNEKLDVDINGYYVGLVPYGHLQDIYKMNGYLFSAKKNLELFYSENSFNSIFELMFLAPHGSTKKYCCQSDKCKVELYDYEAQGIQMDDDINEFQKGALLFADIWYKGSCSDIINITPEVAFKTLSSTFTKPNIKLVDIIGDWCFFDIDTKFIAQPKTLSNYVFKPNSLIKDFKNSIWKIGFLKRLFKINFPYFYIWTLAKKILKRYKNQ